MIITIEYKAWISKYSEAQGTDVRQFCEVYHGIDTETLQTTDFRFYPITKIEREREE